DGVRGLAPSVLVAVYCLEKGLAHIKVWTLHQSISTFVVAGDAYVVEIIFLGERTPMADDVFKKPLSDSVGVLPLKHAKLWPMD
ncbi:hypothetical protein C0993_011907, partial [Termitomyces sp. T159_Od127]